MIIDYPKTIELYDTTRKCKLQVIESSLLSSVVHIKFYFLVTIISSISVF